MTKSANCQQSGPRPTYRNRPPMNNMHYNQTISREQLMDQNNQQRQQRGPPQECQQESQQETQQETQQESQQETQPQPQIQTQQQQPPPEQMSQPQPQRQVPKEEPQVPEEKSQQKPQADGPQKHESQDNINSEMKSEAVDCDASKHTRPFWMKTKLQGVKKITNRERRRRQNETLRRLLAPKNALMVLNEMKPGEAIANQFKVETAGDFGPYSRTNHAFHAELKLESKVYKGYGETKMAARNAAAEQAIRDLIIQRMARVMQPDDGRGPAAMETEGEGESMPMIQLASFALHKLFTEWECGGHHVPQLRTGPAAGEAAAENPAPAKKVRALPERAAAMHPCMLLTYMRPQLAYRELPPEGSRPQDTLYGVALDIDGQTFFGKACNKKEARRMAARSACEAVFGVKFETPS